MRFYPHTSGGGVTVAQGAGGWIDTNVSAETGTDPSKLWIISIFNTVGNDYQGARAHGISTDNKSYSREVVHLSYCDTSGHMDLYRNNIGDNQHRFLGYLL